MPSIKLPCNANLSEKPRGSSATLLGTICKTLDKTSIPDGPPSDRRPSKVAMGPRPPAPPPKVPPPLPPKPPGPPPPEQAPLPSPDALLIVGTVTFPFPPMGGGGGGGGGSPGTPTKAPGLEAGSRNGSLLPQPQPPQPPLPIMPLLPPLPSPSGLGTCPSGKLRSWLSLAAHSGYQGWMLSSCMCSNIIDTAPGMPSTGPNMVTNWSAPWPVPP
mmetsp:Transcript_139384/g.445773  ORF Transcript_139384/g.445773 Transcript_139384/m.445773 type:complete len:215 (+) Transcript_139384:498-1142(+)